jgi:hypothetical protein
LATRSVGTNIRRMGEHSVIMMSQVPAPRLRRRKATASRDATTPTMPTSSKWRRVAATKSESTPSCLPRGGEGAGETIGETLLRLRRGTGLLLRGRRGYATERATGMSTGVDAAVSRLALTSPPRSLGGGVCTRARSCGSEGSTESAPEVEMDVSRSGWLGGGSADGNGANIHTTEV